MKRNERVDLEHKKMQGAGQTLKRESGGLLIAVSLKANRYR